ncbi:polygalacturonase 1 beta-like protein 3 [Vicia villosa]|uniref:polygalacturonase 1 beta-like protein 3 n=1 Tax=Vicia villosa TaxID=3911 RepID=UPI00273CC76E|nr:polygalacturonase 1 beta-like protein 3 [Vicia villosa]XP_058776467.1 polygalacturonase 1 beta-like protein 3 [Vicia villosa]
MNKQLILICLFILFSSIIVTITGDAVAGDNNPFTPRAYVNRYWDKEIRNSLPKPSFLFSKASPLSTVEAATFAKLAAGNTLSTRLPEFCSAAKLLCIPEVAASLEKHDKDANFAVYKDKNFTNYGTSRPGGIDSFKSYSDGENIPVNDFRRYSRNSAGHKDSFTSYATESNVADESFHTYGTGATGGTGDFKQYTKETNNPTLAFTSYSDSSNGRTQSFTSYTENGNAGDQSFSSYGKNGNGPAEEFISYGTSTNVVGSSFSNYAETSNAGNDSFTNYGEDMNNPTNNFNNYANGANGATQTFSNYREKANVGADSFTSYAKIANAAEVDFNNYGKSFNDGTDTFTSYAKTSSGETKVNFKGYGVKNSFKEYTKEGVSFAKYTNASSTTLEEKKNTVSGNLVKKWVEPGKFFREKTLKEGTVMPMPDISDKLPKRSFLPRSILSKLPFSTSKIDEMKALFKASDNGSMEKMMRDTLGDCERVPSRGETKRCVGSIEDMIDFATSVLGRNVVVRTTQNLNGSKKSVMVGRVSGINGGKVTRSVSCHQSLFPSLLYYCHSVPKVRVYQADLLDPKSKDKINQGVAVCHLDTSDWSPTHGAFMSLGSGPGRIEVCHWIFENDMSWTVAD